MHNKYIYFSFFCCIFSFAQGMSPREVSPARQTEYGSDLHIYRNAHKRSLSIASQQKEQEILLRVQETYTRLKKCLDCAQPNNTLLPRS